MNAGIEEISAMRKMWVEANRVNGFEKGLKKLLTDLYPDSAHFVYELLQNAEDAAAKTVRFHLDEDKLIFEHDGEKLFTAKDVEAITSIGFSTKRQDTTKIGKFGVGFKAVFAYTNSPEIESGKYHFRIHDMVVPEAVNFIDSNKRKLKTIFTIPFNNPKKPKEKAVREIEKLLTTLDDTTLLFLSNIRRMEYTLSDSKTGFIERIEHHDHINEIRLQLSEESSSQSKWYLVQEKEVQIEDDEAEDQDSSLKDCRIAIAFGIQEENLNDDAATPTLNDTSDRTWELTPITHGKVCIYFPADKETSNLRFHLHAPFASTVARDSVRECAGNTQLRDYLADLLAESMHKIKNLGLLNVKALALLPNEKDNLSDFYLPFMKRLIREFKTKPLVPMKQGGFAPASGIFRGLKTLSDLISDDDLVTLLGEEYEPPLWTANPAQLNQREDNYLSMLGIVKWDENDLVKTMKTAEMDLGKGWMIHKTDSWHQRFYAHLADHAELLEELKIVKISDDTYREGRESYFPTDGEEYDHDLPRVSKNVYENSNSSKEQRAKARRFLVGLGVREVDEKVEIESILNKYYLNYDTTLKNIKNHISHLQKIISFWKNNPRSGLVFGKYYLLLGEGENQDKFCQAGGLYIDEPYAQTGLGQYFGMHKPGLCKRLLAKCYRKYKVETKELIDFAKAHGACSILPIQEISVTQNHPQWNYLDKYGGDRNRGRHTNQDYSIEYLEAFLSQPSVQKSLLVWLTLKEACQRYHPNFLEAKFGRNKSNIQTATSTLAHSLKSTEWVPQSYGDKTEFVTPQEALSEQLPAGFDYDNGWRWLKALEFGQSAKEREVQDRIKKERETENYKRKAEILSEIGFNSPEEAKEIARLLKAKPVEIQNLLNSLQESNSDPIFREHTVLNPERRREKLLEEIIISPCKTYDLRERSVRTSTNQIDPTTRLRFLYKIGEGELSCQVCKQGMPFYNRKGIHHFEAVEVLAKDHLPKEHEAQYLALCPTCAAKYKEFIKSVPAEMARLKENILNAKGLEIPITLGDESTNIRFEKNHLFDLKTILNTAS